MYQSRVLHYVMGAPCGHAMMCYCQSSHIESSWPAMKSVYKESIAYSIGVDGVILLAAGVHWQCHCNKADNSPEKLLNLQPA